MTLQALDKCQLGDVIREHDKKLDAPGTKTEFIAYYFYSKIVEFFFSLSHIVPLFH